MPFAYNEMYYSFPGYPSPRLVSVKESPDVALLPWLVSARKRTSRSNIGLFHTI